MKEVELVEKRGKYEKHFLQPNGTIVAKIYNSPIHYLKAGKYEEIDNTLVEENGYFTNKENDYKVHFNKKSNEHLMKLEKNGNFLNIKIKDNKEVKIKKAKSLSKMIEQVSYKNIFDGIDMEYKVFPSKIKETIRLNSKNDIKEKIEFVIDTNLDLTIENKSVIAKSKKETIFSIDSPYMVDADGNYNYNSYYELQKNDNEYILTLILDTKWLQLSKVKYPVLIDPTIIESGSNVNDTYIYSGDTSDVRHNKDFIIAGVEKINNKNRINRALLKFDLPNIGTSDEIISAQLHLYGYLAVPEERELTEEEAAENTDKLITIHQITKNWTLENANWNSMSDSYNKNVENIGFVSRSYFVLDTSGGKVQYRPVITSSKNEILITDLVKKWYTGTPNYGIMVKQATEEYINKMMPMFFSSNYGNEELSPVLSVQYRNQNGLEPYFDYMSQTFTNGNTYINTFNGNLVSIFSVAYTIGVFPISLGIVYNTNDVILNKKSIYGNGYKLTCDQTIEKTKIDDYEVLKYDDEDGTIHYFYKDDDTNKYYDDDGLGLEIELTSDECKLSDKMGNIQLFTKNGEIYYLSGFKNVSNQEIKIIRNSSNNITKIIDYNNNEVNVLYETNKITFTSPSENVILNYEENKLKTLVSKEGTTTFSYDDKNVLIEIVDVTGMSIKYEYYDGNIKKIKKVTQYGLNSEEGESFTLSYGLLNTKVVDDKGRITTKIYNFYGTLLSMNSMAEGENLKETYSIAENYGTDGKNINKLLSETVPTKYCKNYFKLSDYDDFDSHFIFSIDTYLSDLDIDFDGIGAVCIRSKKANGYIDYIRSIGDNNEIWTIGFKIKTDGKVKVKFYEFQTHGTLYEKEFYKNQDFEKVVYTSNGESFGFEIINEIENANTYIGDIQFEKDDTLNDYNIIENPDFEEGKNGWTLEAKLLDIGPTPNVDEIFNIVDCDNFGNKALKVNMSPINMTNISKTINIKGKKDDLYYLSFWYKNVGIETPPSNDGSGSIVGNSVRVYFQPLEGDLNQCVPTYELNYNRESWQYYSAVFTPYSDYKSIVIELHQGRESGELYVTNFTLIKSLKTNMYEYDDNGNVISVRNTNDLNTFNYNQNNELISATTARGSNLTFEYDNKIYDRVVRAISSSGISNQIVYDEIGNPIKTKISKDYKEEIDNGLYRIRQKGTNKYLNVENNRLTLKSDFCSNTIFKIDKMDDYYKIALAVVSNEFLLESNNVLVLGKNGNNLFKLEKNKNASYHIYLEDENNFKKYLKSTDDTFKFVHDDSDIYENYLYEFYFENVGEIFIENDASYSEDGRFLLSISDSLMEKNFNEINEITGLKTKTIDANNIETNYFYNQKNQLIKISKSNRNINFEYDNKNLLTNIIQENKKITFSYNNFLNVNEVKLNDKKLVTRSFEPNNGNLMKLSYSNGDFIDYEYDDFNRIKKIITSDNAFEYYYNGNNLVRKIKEKNRELTYFYDSEKRITNYIDSRYFDDNRNKTSICIDYSYSSNNKIAKKVINYNDETKYEVVAQYNKEDCIIESDFDNVNVKYSYDDLLRINKLIIDNFYNVEYEYVSFGNRTSTMIKKYKNNFSEYSYKYDNLYNITDIYENNNHINHYEYDEYNELVKNIDYSNNRIVEYAYDNSGNIINRKITDQKNGNTISNDNFEYTNKEWSDLLTKYNDTEIIYDEIGNPTMIGSIKLSWNNGKHLVNYSDDNNTISFKYDEDGLRKEKNVNGLVFNYFYENNLLIFENRNEKNIYYLYDAVGLVGFKYNNELYYYLRNAQNDIIGIMNQNKDIIAKYVYDAYGNILSVLDSSGKIVEDSEFIGHINPFRYRGYYYDEETQLYYINSRYYNPKWGRFINTDEDISNDILGTNLFIYCGNNPICRIDESGESFWLVVGIGLLGGLLGALGKGLLNAYEGKNVTDGMVTSAANGVFLSILTTTNLSVAASAVVGSIGSATIDEASSYVTSNKKLNKKNVIKSVENIAKTSIANLPVSIASGAIANKIAPVNHGWFKPKKLGTVLTGSYTSKLSKQNLISSGVSTLASFLSDFNTSSRDFENNRHHYGEKYACVVPKPNRGYELGTVIDRKQYTCQ